MQQATRSLVACRSARRVVGQFYHFVKEDSVWKLDMMQLMKLVNVAFDHMLQESGMTEDEFTKKMLEATTGKILTDDIWTPEAEPEK